jgi:hypothetical protein
MLRGLSWVCRKIAGLNLKVQTLLPTFSVVKLPHCALRDIRWKKVVVVGTPWSRSHRTRTLYQVGVCGGMANEASAGVREMSGR